MSTELTDSLPNWDGVRSTLSLIRAGRGEFRRTVFDTLENIERMGDELWEHELRSEHETIDPQVAQLTTLISELAGMLADHKRATAEERQGWAKELRRLRTEVLSTSGRRHGVAQ